MSLGSRRGWSDTVRLIALSARLVAGRRFWAAPLLVLLWPVLLMVGLLLGWREQDYGPADAQNVLIGLPLAVLAMGFGVRIIAGEIDRRTLEIAYTVPGGAQRVWFAKIAAALSMLVAAEILLAGVTFLFFTEFPAGSLYGALQSAVFYMVLAMATSTLFKSEATGALVAVGILALNGLVTSFGAVQLRGSPFWNPESLQGVEAPEALAWTLQNRIGFVLAIGAIVALTFARAERREKMLGS